MCFFVFLFGKRSLIKMETSFLPLHYFERNFSPNNHILLWSLFLVYEKGWESLKACLFSQWPSAVKFLPENEHPWVFPYPYLWILIITQLICNGCHLSSYTFHLESTEFYRCRQSSKVGEIANQLKSVYDVYSHLNLVDRNKGKKELNFPILPTS